MNISSRGEMKLNFMKEYMWAGKFSSEVNAHRALVFISPLLDRGELRFISWLLERWTVKVGEMNISARGELIANLSYQFSLNLIFVSPQLDWAELRLKVWLSYGWLSAAELWRWERWRSALFFSQGQLIANLRNQFSLSLIFISPQYIGESWDSHLGHCKDDHRPNNFEGGRDED